MDDIAITCHRCSRVCGEVCTLYSSPVISHRTSHFHRAGEPPVSLSRVSGILLDLLLFWLALWRLDLLVGMAAILILIIIGLIQLSRWRKSSFKSSLM